MGRPECQRSWGNLQATSLTEKAADPIRAVGTQERGDASERATIEHAGDHKRGMRDRIDLGEAHVIEEDARLGEDLVWDRRHG